ncbi:MAG: hypothetical protein AAGC77_05905 [Pseudomonadota bacterium]
MTNAAAPSQIFRRLIASLIAIGAVSVIFGAKALELENRAAAATLDITAPELRP